LEGAAVTLRDVSGWASMETIGDDDVPVVTLKCKMIWATLPSCVYR
jgi:hypothetical protein